MTGSGCSSTDAGQRTQAQEEQPGATTVRGYSMGANRLQTCQCNPALHLLLPEGGNTRKCLQALGGSIPSPSASVPDRCVAQLVERQPLQHQNDQVYWRSGCMQRVPCHCVQGPVVPSP